MSEFESVIWIVIVVVMAVGALIGSGMRANER